MNIIRLLLIFMLTIAPFSCSKTPALSFCEGIDKDGKGVQCGKKFSTGDLTAVVTIAERFETETLTVITSKKTNYKNEKVSDFSHAVGADKSSTAIPLSFYIEGEYLVEVHGKDNRLLGSEWIQIIDTF